MRASLLGALLSLLLVSAPARAAEGDVERGEEIYARCLACHALAHDRVGPRHCGLFGRKAGTVPGYAYSPAMRRYGVLWTEQTLGRFVEDPLRTVPGTRMGYAGVKDAQERADLIAYLKKATADPGLCD